jgi:HipA-like C-terminal domain
VLVSNVDDHLRNHGFLWAGPAGWVLSPAFDLNPVPTDLKPRILSTNINLDEATCSIELVRSAADLYGLSPGAADEIIRKVAASVRGWRKTATMLGAKPSEIERLASAFEHEDLRLAAQVQKFSSQQPLEQCEHCRRVRLKPQRQPELAPTFVGPQPQKALSFGLPSGNLRPLIVCLL